MKCLQRSKQAAHFQPLAALELAAWHIESYFARTHRVST